MHIGLMAEAWRCFRRAARSPLWENWDQQIRRINLATAEAIGWPALEARRLVLGAAPFDNFTRMLLLDLRKLPSPPPSALRAVHEIAMRQHRGGLAAQRITASGLEKWARTLLPALAKTPDLGAAYAAECLPALEWLRELDASTISKERWVAYFDQVYRDSELAAIRDLQAEVMISRPDR